MNTILVLSIIVFIICVAFISYTLFRECKRQGFYLTKKITRDMDELKKDYVVFGIGLGPSISGFSLVEILKGSTDVNGWALFIIFFAGVYIFELSRRISKKTS